MNSQSLFRFGGIAAIISALLYVVSIFLWMGEGEGAAPPPLAAAAYAASSLIFLVTLVALYGLHRSEAPGLSLAAVVLVAISTTASFFVDPTDYANPIVLALTACYGLGVLFLGWLAYRSPQLPQGLGILAMVMGAATLSMLVPMLTGVTGIVDVANQVVGILYAVWLLWLGWAFLRGTAAVAHPA